ncbi:hypothetical protein ACF05W_25250 [Streptomyces lydicus]|uniref:hypothetical protein n=1 Tax=Streptomyces lydicus TaxID=47763 RepID=UPI0036F9AF5F
MRGKEIEVEQRDEPFGKEQPRPRAHGAVKNREVESAGDHGGDIDELLDAGNALRKDSHQYSPPAFLNGDEDSHRLP